MVTEIMFAFAERICRYMNGCRSIKIMLSDHPVPFRKLRVAKIRLQWQMSR